MTLCNSTEIECPKCGCEGEFTVWESVNNDVSPKEAVQVADGSLFTFTCPSCGAKTQIVYRCLYHDMKHFAMIQLAPTEDDARGFIEGIKAMQNNDLMSKIAEENKYTYRIVTTTDELQEKALILNAGLDDRVIELIKVMIRAKLSDQEEYSADEEIYFDSCSNDALSFGLFSEKGSRSLDLPQGLYTDFAAVLSKREEPKNPEFSIGERWALEVLSSSDK